jgi:hypothetical protein
VTACFAAEPHAALRALDAWGWLHALAHDLDRVERAVQPPAPNVPTPTPTPVRA